MAEAKGFGQVGGTRAKRAKNTLSAGSTPTRQR
jgi:hypothetical protein